MDEILDAILTLGYKLPFDSQSDDAGGFDLRIAEIRKQIADNGELSPMQLACLRKIFA